jgi:hypothetical protein
LVVEFLEGCYLGKGLLSWEGAVILGRGCYLGKGLLSWEGAVILRRGCYLEKELLFERCWGCCLGRGAVGLAGD